MNHDVIVTCAVTGAGDTVGKHPAIPVTPKQIAEKILSRHFKGNDDALVLVARYLGKRHE